MARTDPYSKSGLFDRLRSYWSGPLTAKSPEIARLFGGEQTLSGMTVNEHTALTSSAVFSAVSLIADDIASLPLFLYKRLPNGGKDRFEAHPLYRLLHDAPNPEMDSMVWRRTMQAHALLWQNAYAEIERNGAGQPIAVWPLVPERVTPFRDASGTLRFRVANDSGRDVVIDSADMLHLVGHSHDGSVGSNLVRLAKESIGLTLAAEKLGQAFFGNGMTFGGVVSYPVGAKPPEGSAKGDTERIEARHQGVTRAFRLLNLFNGASFTKIGVTPNEGQFNETRVFQIREIARWFKIPPHKLGDLADATFSNVEQQDAAYYSSCIRPWLVLWEQQLSRKLIAPLERKQQFIEHDTHGFLSVDAASRAELYTQGFRVGGVTPNEIRGYENRDPLAGGDRGFVSLDVIPMDYVDDYWQALIESKKAPKEAPPNNGGDVPGPADNRAIETLLVRIEALTTSEARAQQDAERAEQEKRAAAQRAEDLSAARDEQQRRADEAEANLSQTIELLDGAKVALATEQSERALDVARRDGRIAELEAVSGDWENLAHTFEAGKQAEAARAELAETQVRTQESSIATLTADREAERAEWDRHRGGFEEQIDMLQESYASLKEDRDDLQQTLSSVRAAHTVALAALEGERDAARVDTATVAAERDTARAETDKLRAIWEKDRDALNMMTADVIARGVELAAAARDKAIAEQAQAAANDTIASLQADLGAARAAHQQTRDDHAARVHGVLVAHRGLIVDVMRRMVEREIDRAKRHQTTPQKFRSWLDSFYLTHTDAVAEALLPAVKAHLSILSSPSDPYEMARQLAEDHVAESSKQLRDLLHVEDFGPMLERTLMQWETARPEAVADRLLTRGLADVR